MSSPASSPVRTVAISRAEFSARFGDPDLGGALCGYTRENDTRTVLTLLCHATPTRVPEVGMALGHMTANLTRRAPVDARVFTLDLVRGMPAPCPARPSKRSRCPRIPNGAGSRTTSARPTRRASSRLTR